MSSPSTSIAHWPIAQWPCPPGVRSLAAGLLLIGFLGSGEVHSEKDIIRVAQAVDSTDEGRAPANDPPSEPTAAAISQLPSPEDRIRNAIEIAVAAWAQAWSNRDVAGYLSQYASSFEPGNANLSLDAWKALRKTRLTTPKFIEVSVSNLDIAVFDSGVNLVTFVQDYRSDIFQERSLKSLEFIEENGQWKIASERSIRLLN